MLYSSFVHSLHVQSSCKEITYTVGFGASLYLRRKVFTMSERFVANLGGTAPENLRKCFDVWAKEYSHTSRWRTRLMLDQDTGKRHDIKSLCGQLWNCTDDFPADAVQASAENLKLGYNANYSQVVRFIKKNMSKQSDNGGFVAEKPMTSRGVIHGELVEEDTPEDTASGK